MKNFETDTWLIENNSWEVINEASGKPVVDGVSILARVVGQMFVPNGMSQNKRFYPKSLWEKVLNKTDVQKKLNTKTMFGRIGHENRPVSEEDLNSGAASHIVNKMWIDSNNRGMGEILVLNTNAGRNLNTYLRAGSVLKTSTRASGSFLKSRTHEGVPIVDEDSYILETIDFVIEPGFVETDPRIVENMEEITMVNDKDQLNTMSENYFKLQESHNAVVTENVTLKARLEILEKKNESLQEFELIGEKANNFIEFLKLLKNKNMDSLKEASNFLENLSLSDINAIKSCNGSVSDAIFESEEYRNIGTVSEINESVTMASQELEAWKKEFGTREELDETLERLASLLEAYTEIGTPDEIENAINAAENALSGYREIGTIPDIVETLQRAERSLVGYTSLGDIVTVSEKLDRYDSMLEEYESKLREDKAMTLSGRYNIPVEKVASLLEKLSYEETVNFLEDFSSVASFSESVKPQYMSEDFSRQTRQDSGAARVFKRATRLIK